MFNKGSSIAQNIHSNNNQNDSENIVFNNVTTDPQQKAKTNFSINKSKYNEYNLNRKKENINFQHNEEISDYRHVNTQNNYHSEEGSGFRSIYQSNNGQLQTPVPYRSKLQELERSSISQNKKVKDHYYNKKNKTHFSQSTLNDDEYTIKVEKFNIPFEDSQYDYDIESQKSNVNALRLAFADQNKMQILELRRTKIGMKRNARILSIIILFMFLVIIYLIYLHAKLVHLELIRGNR